MTITIRVWQEGERWRASCTANVCDFTLPLFGRTDAIRAAKEFALDLIKRFDIPDEIRFVVMEGRP